MQRSRRIKRRPVRSEHSWNNCRNASRDQDLTESTTLENIDELLVLIIRNSVFPLTAKGWMLPVDVVASEKNFLSLASRIRLKRDSESAIMPFVLS